MSKVLTRKADLSTIEEGVLFKVSDYKSYFPIYTPKNRSNSSSRTAYCISKELTPDGDGIICDVYDKTFTLLGTGVCKESAGEVTIIETRKDIVEAVLDMGELDDIDIAKTWLYWMCNGWDMSDLQKIDDKNYKKLIATDCGKYYEHLKNIRRDIDDSFSDLHIENSYKDMINWQYENVAPFDMLGVPIKERDHKDYLYLETNDVWVFFYAMS